MGESCCATCEQFAGKDVEPVERKPLEAAPAAQFKIRVTERGRAPFEYVPTKPEVNIGRVRDGNDITLPNGNVSKRATRIVFDPRGVIVLDLKSSCGTYVDGRKITSPVKLGEHSKIYIADFTLEVIRG
jgi:pilus assembly protein CpaF